MSGKYLLLSFMGRKTRTKYTTPVAYLREGDTFLMTTDSPWWKNLHGGAPVTLWVKGQEYKGMGEAVTDETEVVCVLGRFLEAQPGYAKYVGLKRGAGGRTDRAQIERIARERVLRARPIYSWGRVGDRRTAFREPLQFIVTTVTAVTLHISRGFLRDDPLLGSAIYRHRQKFFSMRFS